MKKENIKSNDEEFKGSIISIVTLIISTIVIAIVVILLRNNYIKDIGKKNNNTSIPKTEGVEVYPTMLDTISSDSIWCPTFELVWQDMINKEVGVNGNIYFKPTILIAENLNKRYFTENDISDEYYYKVYGPKTLELKETIEKNIKEKFNQTSDILDKFSWDEKDLDGASNGNRLFFYTMLYREFEFPYVFDKLENSKFKDYENIKYFGIDKNTDTMVRSNVRVLFYDDEDNFAIKLRTKNNDEVIFYKNPKGTTFKEIYDNLTNNSENYYEGRLKDEETVKIPYLKINVLREYTEFANKVFYDIDDNVLGIIYKALQTVQFEINEKGGKVKSEAAIDMRENSFVLEPTKPRVFNIDDTFALFLKESDKDKPYLALMIDDITKYQSEVE